MSKIDIKNSYIKNDKGPLRQFWFNEAVSQGYVDGEGVGYYSATYCVISPAGLDASDNIDFVSDLKELTLADFEPKKAVIDVFNELQADLSNLKNGLKFDQDKPRYDLIPAHATNELAKVLTFGAKKYAPNSWRNVEDGLNRYRAALLRHTFAIQRGETHDEESGLLHSAHAQCCAAFITELELISKCEIQGKL